MVNKSYQFIAISILLLCPWRSVALDGKAHVFDMAGVMPFVNVRENKVVFDFYKMVNQYLDRPGLEPGAPFDKHAPRRPQFVVDHPRLSSVKWMGRHRIWYHWGFNTDPHKYAPLVESLDKAVCQGVIGETDVALFWQLLLKEVGTRNRTLMNQGSVVFGFGQLGTISSAQRKQLNGLVTILYSVHVIGDHETPDSNIIVSLDRVYADVYNAIDNIAGKQPDNAAKAKVLKAALRKSQGNPRAFISAMQHDFGPFLLALSGDGYEYKSRFLKKGYVLR